MRRTVCRSLAVLGLGALLLAIGVRAGGQKQAPPAGLGITRLVIDQRQVVYGGQSFGSAGTYELLTGTAYGELDPKAPGNMGIVNLDGAPRNPKGHV